MFPSSLNTKRRAACAAKGKNVSKSIPSQEGEIIIEETYTNISHIGSFLKKRSSFSTASSNQPKPAQQAVNNKKLKKIIKDLPSVPKDSQFLIIDSDSDISTSEEAYLQDSSSNSPSKGHCAQFTSKSNESFFINGFNKIQNADRHNFTLEASSSETSTTASSEFRVEEDIEIIRDPSTCKKVKKDTDATYRYCARKDSMLSTSSETQMWFGNGERANCFDDSYPCGSSLSSNFPTPNFTSSTPQTNLISSNPSSYKNEHSCFLLDDAELHNLPTRKNSYDSCTSPDSCDLLSSSSHCSPNKDGSSKFGSSDLSSLKQKLQHLNNLQYHQLQQQQIKIDAELAASQAKEQEEKRQEMNKLIEQGRKLVEQRMGRLAAENQVINGYPCCTFTIRCFLKHTFVINVEELLAGTWCNKCDENLKKAKEYAEENKGLCLSQFYGKTLKFKCSKNHTWESSHQTYKQRWCSQCKKIVKDQFKQYIKDEEAKKQAEYQKNQEEMYKEARRKAMISQNCNEANPSSEDYKKKVILAAKQVEREVEKIAEQQARDYIKNEQKDSESPCSFPQLRELFKMILFPDSILQVYYCNLEIEVLKTEYRNVARYIHPDKNSHPRAAESFQKLNNYYTLALPKV